MPQFRCCLLGEDRAGFITYVNHQTTYTVEMLCIGGCRSRLIT